MPDLPPRFSLRPASAAPKAIKRRGNWQHDGSTTERGYGWQWQKLRRVILARDPLCVPCLAAGHITASAEVDHIKSKADGGSDEPDNLRGICTACHRAKTAADNERARLAERYHIPRPRKP